LGAFFGPFPWIIQLGVPGIFKILIWQGLKGRGKNREGLFFLLGTWEAILKKGLGPGGKELISGLGLKIFPIFSFWGRGPLRKGKEFKGALFL